ncbi:MAG: carbohydrate porin [Endomicrobium sp.]|nr:carbohydrate porin [Endomicrobium sp.]
MAATDKVWSSLRLDVNGYLDFIVQCSPRRNIDDSRITKKFQEVVDGSFLGGLYIIKHVNEDSLIRTHFKVTKGVGLNDKFLLYSSLNSCVGTANISTNVFPELVEVLWEQNLFNKKLTIDFGMLNPTLYFDVNTIANDGNYQFLASAFVNNAAVPFPSYTLGLRAKYSICTFLDLNYAYFGRDDHIWSELGKNNSNFFEVTYKPSNNENYRFLLWKNFQNEYAQGFGFNLDQSLSKTVILFGRLGYQNSNSPYYIVENTYCNKSWSAGVQLNGNGWNRLKDVLGIAIGQNFIEKYPYKTPETQAEVYYKYVLNNSLHISPIIQYVDCPYSGSLNNETTTTKNIFTFGVRTNITF